MKERVLIILTSIFIFYGLLSFGNGNDGSGTICETSEGNTQVAQNALATIDLFASVNNNNPSNVPFYYYVGSKYQKTITKSQLNKVELVDDLIVKYPSSWIDEYEKVEIITSKNGYERNAIAPNNILTDEQKSLFNSMLYGDSYSLSVKFWSKNVVTNKLEEREIYINMSVVPEQEAEYIGGYETMISYIKENSSKKISDHGLAMLDPASMQFTINKQGEIEDLFLNQSSGDKNIDAILMNTLKNMPKWKPAEDASGSNVDQTFVFNFGMDGC